MKAEIFDALHPRRFGFLVTRHNGTTRLTPLESVQYAMLLSSTLFSTGIATPSTLARELAEEHAECAGWLNGTRGVYRDKHTRQANRGGFTSQFCQDRALFESVYAQSLGRRRGVYVDLASNHYKRISNTYFFDRCLGWRGVCVRGAVDHTCAPRGTRTSH